MWIFIYAAVAIAILFIAALAGHREGNKDIVKEERMKKRMKKEWWKERNEVLWKLYYLGTNLKVEPNVITASKRSEERLKVIGKAIEVLVYCLIQIIKDDTDALNKITEEDISWYRTAIRYWEKNRNI